MKIKIVIFALIASISAAAAADIPGPGPAPPPAYRPPPISPAYNWTGFYLGAMGGYGWSDQVTLAGIVSTNPDINGGFAGGTVGFNYQAPGSMVLLGVESDAAWSDVQHTVTAGIVSAQERVMSFGSVTGRVGVAVNNALSMERAATGGPRTRLTARRLV